MSEPTSVIPDVESRTKMLAAVNALVRRMERGPWDEELSDRERFETFKQLVRDRGERYAACTLANYQLRHGSRQTAVVDALKDFAAAMPERLAGGGGLILYGPEGTGKDHLQFAMLHAAIVEHGFSATWRDGLRLQAEYFAAIKSDETERLRRMLAAPQILAVSDPLPPQGELKDWSLGFLRDVVDRRYQARRSTWLTLNAADLATELKAALTPPLAARLLDGSLCLHCNWPSFRKERK